MNSSSTQLDVAPLDVGRMSLAPQLLSNSAPKSSGLNEFGLAAVLVVAAVREGLVSMHRYEQLRGHGLPHAAAASQACAINQ
jgi:hypothetical protein